MSKPDKPLDDSVEASEARGSAGWTPGPWQWIDTTVYGDPATGPNKNCLVGPVKDTSRKPYPTDSCDHILYLEEPVNQDDPYIRLITAAPELHEALSSEALFLRRFLVRLISVPMTDERGHVVNRFAAAQIPDWEIRQRLDDIDAALAKARGGSPVQSRVDSGDAPTATQGHQQFEDHEQ